MRDENDHESLHLAIISVPNCVQLFVFRDVSTSSISPCFFNLDLGSIIFYVWMFLGILGFMINDHPRKHLI